MKDSPSSPPQDQHPGASHLAAIERWTLLFGALVMAWALLFGGARDQLGATCGVGMMVLNAVALRRLSGRIVPRLQDPAAHKASLLMLALFLFNGKLVILAALIYLCIRMLPVSPLGLTLGLSVLPAAILARALQFMTMNPSKGSPHG